MSPAPKATDELKDAFRALVPAAPGVTVRPMFGHVAAFVNGNMFTGLFGEGLFVRASGADRDSLLAAGGEDFAPMPGRPMNGYVMVPGWHGDQTGTRKRIDRALAVTSEMAPKEPKARKKK